MLKRVTCIFLTLLALSGCDSRQVKVSSNTDSGLSSNSGGASISGQASSSAQAFPRIINGSLVDPATSPQFVEVFIFNGSAADPAICSGTIIGPTSVLTAAHCVQPPVASITVRAGEQFFPVQRVAYPPSYREDDTLGAIFDDLAVLNTPPLGRPALPIVSTVPATIEGVFSTFGFGLDEDGAVGTLRAGATSVTNITPNHFFTSFSGGSADSCFGDSGGPLVMFYTDPLTNQFSAGIVGIVSTGSSIDCSSGDVSLYTNLQNPGLLAFIQRFAPGVAIR